MERQTSQMEMNVAALTAELEALELSPRPAEVSPEDEESGGSVSDAFSPRGHRDGHSAHHGGGGGHSMSSPSLSSDRRGVPPSGVARLRQLVNELVQDNDLLQKEYLELLQLYRIATSSSPSMGHKSMTSSSSSGNLHAAAGSGSSSRASLTSASGSRRTWLGGRRRKKEGDSDRSDNEDDKGGQQGQPLQGEEDRLAWNEAALHKAARGKLETLVRDLLDDKRLLEAALVAAIKASK